MNERDAFVRGIAANLYDDAPRLAFADYLDEHGEHDRAEFIRVQCEFGHRDTADDEFADTFPEGHGGRTWRNIRNGEWVFGWDRYGDKRGRIHST